MPSHPLARSTYSPREMLLWAFLGTVVVAQLLIFWMLCNQQVRKAEMRDASVRGQRVALADCLHRATLSACATQLQAAARHEGSTLMAGSTGTGDMNSTVPVNFVFR